MMDTENNRKIILLGAVFIQLIFGTVCEYPLYQCGYCDCCAGACDVASNYTCDDAGCIDGYWGDPQCLHRCLDDDPCLACGQGGGAWCTKCNSGYYVPTSANNANAHCTLNCYSRCKTCTDSWSNCQICIDGYVNIGSRTDCPYTCPSNCDTCSSRNVCSGCKPGFYDVANNCNKVCLQNCSRCNEANACTECKPELHGNLEYNDCRLPCPTNCVSCISYSNCSVCKPGYYGNACQFKCSQGCTSKSCDKDTGECPSCWLCFTGDKCDTCVGGKYGHYCNLTCSTSCPNGQCEMDNGYCTECLPNMFGKYCEYNCSENCYSDNSSSLICNKESGDCIQGCKTGYFGFQCNSLCNQNCVDRVCNKSDGWCTNMCVKGFQGPTCAEAEKQLSEEPDDSGAAIGGAVGGVLAVLVIGVIGIIVFVIRRRRIAKRSSADKPIKDDGTNPVYENSESVSQVKQPKQNAQTQIVEKIEEEENEPTDFSQDNGVLVNEENTYYNTEQLLVSGLYQYVSGRTTHAFKAEFKSIPNGLQKEYSVSQEPENMPKNRYKGIYPYDHSRVTVEGDNDFYMNACFIDGYKTKREYIASLGPTVATTDNFVSFWQMIWHHKVDTIVMLTNLIENQTEKCDQYWPDLGATVQYGKFAVTGQKENVYVEYTATRLKLSYNGEDRIVHHLHFTVWPDKSVPEDVTSLVEFREKVNSIREDNNTPIVVHCSAGVGRTGTYIALDKLTKECKETGEVNVIRCVHGMREQRVNMVQTADQYEYLHKCLVYTLTSDCRLLNTDEIKTVLLNNPDDEFTNIRQLLQLDMNNDEADAIAREKNKTFGDKNRHRADVPGDKWRPRLFLNRGFNDSDYINAVYLNSFACTNRFIIAQTPLPETVEDFLALVYQTKATCIVCLDDAVEHGKDVGLYQTPDNQEMKQGPFTISSEKNQSSEQYTEKKLRIKLSRGKTHEEKTIQHLQFSNWPTGERAPVDPASFVQFTKLVDRISSSEQTEESIILVHCLNGAERSGLFCAVAVLLEKLQLERHVSVLNTLRQIRLRRKTAIPNKEQVKFCYQCLSASQEEKDIYYNL